MVAFSRHICFETPLSCLGIWKCKLAAVAVSVSRETYQVAIASTFRIPKRFQIASRWGYWSHAMGLKDRSNAQVICNFSFTRYEILPKMA